MKITGKAKTAIKVLIILGSSEKRLSVREIAEKDDLPIRYLEQIVSLLKKNAFINSTKGATGGYALSKNSAEISVLDIVHATEGVNHYSETSEGLLMMSINELVLNSLDDLIKNHLSHVTLDQLIEDYKKKTNQEYMYYI